MEQWKYAAYAVVYLKTKFNAVTFTTVCIRVIDGVKINLSNTKINCTVS